MINIQEFLEKIKTESSYQKIVELKVFDKLFEIFSQKWIKSDYSFTIANALEMALEFYKNYNIQYYEKIINGIYNNHIIIGKNLDKSYVETNNDKAYIGLVGNDSDLFLLVHEFAHFIDRNSDPSIFSNKFWFLSEVFSFYMEKKILKIKYWIFVERILSIDCE